MTSVPNPQKLRLEQFLNFLENAIDEKRRVLEEICQESEALFKPWPKNSSTDEDNNKNKKKEIDTPVDEMLLSTEEQKEMTLVNSLLKRAEKARMIHKKIIEKEKSADILESGGTLSRVEQCENKKIDQDKKCSKENSKNDEEKKHNMMTQNNQNSLRETVSKETSNINTNPTGKVKSEKLSSTNNQTVPIRQVVDRPSSSRSTNSTGSRPSSKGSVKTSRSTSCTRNKATPVHMHAPFQTNPNIKIPKKNFKENKALLVPKPVIKSKYMNSTKCNRKNIVKRNLPPSTDRHCEQKTVGLTQHKDMKELENISCHPLADNFVIPESGNIVNIEECEPVSINPHSTSNSELGSNKVSIDTHNVIENLNKLQLDNAAIISDKDSDRFLLSKDGAKLEIPSKLKKLLGKNRKIRQKVSKVSMTKKIGTCTSNREKFCTSMESLFDKNSRLAIKYRKLQCLTTHYKLQELFSHLQLHTINELSTPYEVLHAKMMVEFILTTYHELEEETQQILNDTSKDKPIFALVSFERPKVLSDRWLPVQINSDKIKIPHHINYTKKRDLLHFQTSIYKLQHLQLQRHVINLIQTDLLPEVQSIDHTLSRKDTAFYQNVAALLTHQGKHFPV